MVSSWPGSRCLTRLNLTNGSERIANSTTISRLALLHTLGEHYATQRAYDEMKQLAAKQLALEPWREEAHRQLMLAMARSDHRSEALAHFEVVRNILARELGVEPSEETVALYQSIRSDTVHGGSSLQRRPLAPDSVTAAKLYGFPRQSGEFTGRERELDTVLEHFLRRERRLMTLVSVGGMGKRRLAVEAARRMVQAQEVFREGACFVSLANTSAQDQMVEAIAQSCRIPLQDGLPRLQQLIAAFQDREVLLVLDGIECVAGGDDAVAQILGQTESVCILCTSLRPLGLARERILVVAGMNCTPDDMGMPDPDSDEDGAPSTLPAAVRMFVQIGREYLPNWTPDDKDVRAILRICRLVDGMPLALSIAAGWMRVMDCHTIAEEIAGNEQFMFISDDEVRGRQRSVGGEFERMWRDLPCEAQQALAQMSVFEGGGAMKAISAITQVERSTLAILVDCGLLRRHGDDRGGTDRLLRHFAKQKLDAKPELQANTWNRHARHYLEQVAAAKDLLRGLVLDEEWLSIILMDLDNIRRAWQWVAKEERLDEAADALPWVCLCFERSGRYADALEMIDTCAKRLETSQRYAGDETGKERQRLAAALKSQRGWFLWRLNRYEEAHIAIRDGLAMLPEHGVGSELSFAYLTLGLVEDSRGHYAAARDAYAQSLRVCEVFGDKVLEGRVPNYLGAATRILGDFDGAIRLHERSLAIGRQISDRWGIAGTLHNLGLAVHALGRLERARTLFEEAIRVSASVADAWAVHVARYPTGGPGN